MGGISFNHGGGKNRFSRERSGIQTVFGGANLETEVWRCEFGLEIVYSTVFFRILVLLLDIMFLKIILAAVNLFCYKAFHCMNISVFT